MKLVKIINAVENLNKLSELLLPAKESFKVVKLLTEIEPQVNNYNLQRNKLLAKYGDSKDEKTFEIRKEDQANFIKEVEDLGSIEIDLKFEKINISNGLTIKASDLINILDFIEIIE